MISRLLIFAIVLFLPTTAFAQLDAALRARAQQEKAPLLDTLKDLVSIESGSGDYEGVTRIGRLIADRLRALGGEVEMVPPPANMVRFQTTPERVGDSVMARFRGRGTKKILLLAHMDTVYQKGMLAQQPFRIDGDSAFGLGIADDKHGIAVILHTLSMLRALQFTDYGLITVFINAAEEVASPSARDAMMQLGAEHDITLSCEGSGPDDSIRLATTGVQLAVLTVKGRASHAGNAPEQGRNAFYELAHQVLQMRDLSDPSKAVKVNWTLGNIGSVANAIPEDARAVADMRANDPRDFAAVEVKMRERVQNKLIPDTTVDLRFERIFPPLPLREVSLRAAEHARQVYTEIGATLKVNETASGGGTDAAFAAMRSTAPVVEGFGLKHFGSHSNTAEYVSIASIEPRLYLLSRMIMDVSTGKLAVAAR